MKLMRTKVLLLVTLFLMASFGIFTNTAMAKGYTWSQYKIGFDIPQSLTIDKNDATEFTASNDSFSFSIYPWKDSTATAKDIIIQAVADLGVTYKDSDVDVHEQPDFNGFNGYEVTGSGIQDGNEIQFRIFGFIDPASDVNLVAYALYTLGVNDDANEKMATSIFESIEKK